MLVNGVEVSSLFLLTPVPRVLARRSEGSLGLKQFFKLLSSFSTIESLCSSRVHQSVLCGDVRGSNVADDGTERHASDRTATITAKPCDDTEYSYLLTA